MAFAFGRKYVEHLSAAENGGQSSNQATEEGPKATIPFDVSGEVSQYLQRLIKREGVTKVKSLQVLRKCMGVCVAAIVEPCIEQTRVDQKNVEPNDRDWLGILGMNPLPRKQSLSCLTGHLFSHACFWMDTVVSGWKPCVPCHPLLNLLDGSWPLSWEACWDHGSSQDQMNLVTSGLRHGALWKRFFQMTRNKKRFYIAGSGF